MYINSGVIVGIVALRPTGTNSTMFTECCEVAIIDSELYCPLCKREVIGYDAISDSERRKIRWKNATAHWIRRG